MARPLAVDLAIESLAPGGAGVAHASIGGERRAVFVPRTAPGDVVTTEVDPSTRPARGRVIRIVTPGPDRVAPACRFADRCGGCDWMHVAPAAQATAHAALVRAALPLAWRGVEISCHRAPEAVGYRTRARVHLRSQRGRLLVGMHEANSHAPVPVDACIVLDPALDRARASLTEWLDGSTGRGEAGLAFGRRRRPVIDLRWRGDVAPAAFGRLDAAVHDSVLDGAVVRLEGASRPAIIGEPEAWAQGADGEPLRLGLGGFTQANERINDVLARHVSDLVRGFGARNAVELYAGAGNLGVVVAPHVGDLVLVESSRESCEAARANLAARRREVRVVHGRAEDYAFAPPTDLVVLDPPRAGARAAAERLAASRVEHVVYVSCDVATLGRDLSVLAGAYELESAATFEMFPQTSHVEAVVTLARQRRPRGTT